MRYARNPDGWGRGRPIPAWLVPAWLVPAWLIPAYAARLVTWGLGPVYISSHLMIAKIARSLT